MARVTFTWFIGKTQQQLQVYTYWDHRMIQQRLTNNDVIGLKQEKVYSVKAPVEGPTTHMNHNHIREIALSPTDGKRLAVVFEKSDGVALYSVQLDSMPTLTKKETLQHM